MAKCLRHLLDKEGFQRGQIAVLMPGEKYLKQRRDIYLKETMKFIQEIASMDSKAWSAEG